jgi:hypothetical protein
MDYKLPIDEIFKGDRPHLGVELKGKELLFCLGFCWWSIGTSGP